MVHAFDACYVHIKIQYYMLPLKSLQAARIPVCHLPVGQRVPLGSGNHDAAQKIILYVVNAMTFGGVTGEELKWYWLLAGLSLNPCIHRRSFIISFASNNIQELGRRQLRSILRILLVWHRR